MENYKLTRIYPGSPAVGTIIVNCTIYKENTNHDKTYTISGRDINCDMGKFRIDNPEDFPEYWEKVIEKDFEILSFIVGYNFGALKKGDKVERISKTNYFAGRSQKGNLIGKSEEDSLLKYPHWFINSIKRLSDGEIFTIDDKIISKFNFTHNIESFEIKDSFLKIGYYCPDKYYYNLNEISKAIKPILTTEDGIDVFDGDSPWCILKDNNQKGSFILHQFTNINDYCTKDFYRYFSTKQAAEDYIKYNKPTLSLKDIMKFIPSSISDDDWSKFIENLESIVKNK